MGGMREKRWLTGRGEKRGLFTGSRRNRDSQRVRGGEPWDL